SLRVSYVAPSSPALSTLSLHDALPILRQQLRARGIADIVDGEPAVAPCRITAIAGRDHVVQRDPPSRPKRRRLAGRAIHSRQPRPEEHTTELQSPYDLVCRPLPETKSQ